MDNIRLEYIVAIVENQFNLTTAARSLYISQPALSKMIKELERRLNIVIFNKKNGRLTGLTTIGESIYNEGKTILAHYKQLNNMISYYSKINHGTIILGIPPVVISFLFTDFLNETKVENPGIDIMVLEEGSSSLETMMHERKLDYAVLLKPVTLDSEIFEQELLYSDTLVAFMDKCNPLAANKFLDWSDLNNTHLINLDKSFGVHHLVTNKLADENVLPRIIDTSTLSEHIFRQIKNTDIITILPRPSKTMFNMKGIIEIPFRNPIYWEIILCYRKVRDHKPVELFILTSIIRYFNNHKVDFFYNT